MRTGQRHHLHLLVSFVHLGHHSEMHTLYHILWRKLSSRSTLMLLLQYYYGSEHLLLLVTAYSPLIKYIVMLSQQLQLLLPLTVLCYTSEQLSDVKFVKIKDLQLPPLTLTVLRSVVLYKELDQGCGVVSLSAPWYIWSPPSASLLARLSLWAQVLGVITEISSWLICLFPP